MHTVTLTDEQMDDLRSVIHYVGCNEETFYHEEKDAGQPLDDMVYAKAARVAKALNFDIDFDL